MVATLSADVVRSTSMETRDLIALRSAIKGLFDDLEEENPGFWARIVRGDTIECYIPDYWRALRIALLIKLLVKIKAGKIEDCSPLLQKYGIRFSIGIGEMKYVNREEDILNGSAIYISGRNLDEIGLDDVYSIIEVDDATRSINHFLNSYVALICHLVDTYTTKQAEVVYYKLRGYTEREISDLLDIFQSSVNMRSSQAQWKLLRDSIVHFENLNLDEICGWKC